MGSHQTYIAVRLVGPSSGCDAGVALDRLEEPRGGPDEAAGMPVLGGLVDELDEALGREIPDTDNDDLSDPVLELAAHAVHLHGDHGAHRGRLDDPIGELACHHAAENVVVDDGPVAGLTAERQVAGSDLFGLALAVGANEQVGVELVVVGMMRELIPALEAVGTAAERSCVVAGGQELVVQLDSLVRAASSS